MDHEAAMQMKASERYVVGDLPASERDEFEDHYSGCSRCMDDVWTASAFAANARAVFEGRAAIKPMAERAGWLAWLRRPVPVLAFSAALNLALFGGLAYQFSQI